jgi:hypothetical protein
MAEDATGSATPPADPPTPGTPQPGAPPSTPPADPPPGQDDEPTDAEGWRELLKRTRREAAERRRDLAKAREQLQAHEDAQKTEQQRLQERAEAAERRAAELETAVLRNRIAAELELPAELAERLRGEDEAAMREDGKRLAAFLRPAGNLGGGRGGTAPPPSADDMNARIRAAAGR